MFENCMYCMKANLKNKMCVLALHIVNHSISPSPRHFCMQMHYPDGSFLFFCKLSLFHKFLHPVLLEVWNNILQLLLLLFNHFLIIYRQNPFHIPKYRNHDFSLDDTFLLSSKLMNWVLSTSKLFFWCWCFIVNSSFIHCHTTIEKVNLQKNVSNNVRKFHADDFFIQRKYQRYPSCTRLKNKFENNSTSEGAFYKSEWVKNNSSFYILCELLLIHSDYFVWPLRKCWTLFIPL